MKGIRRKTQCRAWGSLALALCALIIPKGVESQEFEQFIERYTGANGVGYLTPLAEVIGANLNSGFARSARIEDGFHVRFELLAPISSIGDEQRTFMATTDGFFTPEQTASAPTIFGKSTGTAITGEAGTTYYFPAGFQLNRVGVAMPQLTIGTIAGTEGIFRWMAFDLEDIGDFNHLAVGLRHSISQYLDNAPIDLAVGGLVQNFSLGDEVEAQALAVALHASTGSDLATIYGAVTYETASMDINYTSGNGPEAVAVALQLDGHTGVRVTGGVELGLSFLKIRGDFTVGPQTVFGVGISFGN